MQAGDVGAAGCKSKRRGSKRGGVLEVLLVVGALLEVWVVVGLVQLIRLLNFSSWLLC